MFLFLLMLAIRVYPQSPYEQARDSLNRLLNQSKEDTGKVTLLLALADTYETNNQDSSLYYLEKVKELSDQLKFPRGLYKYHEQSTIVSFTKGEYQKAIQSGEEALKLARQLPDISYELKMLGNLGVVYQYTGKFDKQLKYSFQAMALIEKTDQKKDISSLYHNFANAYYNLNQYRKSIEYCFQSLAFYKRFGGNGYLGRVYSSLGQSYNELNRSDSALHFYTTGVEESKKSGDVYAEAGIYGFMADIYAAVSDFESMRSISYASLKLSRQLQSSQMLASSLYNVAFAEYLNNNDGEAKKNILEALQIAERDSLKDELRNSYTILSYIAAFERSIDMLDSSIKEMRRVAHNMMPEALVKFGLDTALKDFCNDINRSGALQVKYQPIGMEGATVEQTTAITIYRIVQELLNNVIKHAGARNAIVQVSKTNGEISITVEDNGKGFDTTVLRHGKGIGWHNIQSRIEYLKGKLDVQSAPGKGTSVMVEINLNNS